MKQERALLPAVFLDRDGTLMKEVEYCRDPAKVEVFPGVSAGLELLGERGYRRVLVTNQSGIGRGWIAMAEFEAVQEEFLRQIESRMDAVYFCPDAPGGNSPRRKPAPGMLLEAARDLGLDLGHSWMIGDKTDDLLCGRAAGVKTILVRTGYGESARQELADHVAKNFPSAVEFLLRST